MSQIYANNRKNLIYITMVMIIIAAVLLLASCGGSSSGGGGRETRTDCLSPEASGTVTYEQGSVSIDASNAADGYIMVKYSGSAEKIKIRITGPDGVEYTYTSYEGDYQTFPLSAGSGSYAVEVLENVCDDMYSQIISQSISANIEDEFSPYLYPNEYVWYTEDMEAVKLAAKLSKKSSSDLNYIENVYEYVTRHVSYDNELAANAPVDYVPVIDETLDSGKGICFDYASLTAAMLRVQGIPTKLVFGYSGSAYHAWISVYLEESGWVDDIIEFDGNDWSLIDPTLGASASDKTVKKYIGDGTNYTEKYHF